MDLSNASDLRAMVAERLGTDAENIPQERAVDLAKSLGIGPVAAVVEYTTKVGKTGAYLKASDPFKGRGGTFARLGNPDGSCTPEVSKVLRSAAEHHASMATELGALADQCDEYSDSDS